MRVAFLLLALAVIGIVGVQTFQTGLADAGDDVEIDGETFEPDAGNVTQLEQSDRSGVYYDATVTVTDENGNQSIAGTDYRWNQTNGTITTLAGGNLEGDSQATIDYGYEAPNDTQQGMAALLSQIPTTIGFLLPAGLVLVLLAIVRGG